MLSTGREIMLKVEYAARERREDSGGEVVVGDW